MPRNFTPETKKIFREIKGQYIDMRRTNPAAQKRLDRIWLIASDDLDGAGTDDKARAILAGLKRELATFAAPASAGIGKLTR